MPIRLILLDAGGTLVFPNFRRIAEEFGRDGIRLEPDALAQADARVRFDIDRPDIISRIATETDEMRWFRYIENLARHAGAKDVPQTAVDRLKAYHDTENLWEDVPADIPDALDQLSKTYRLGVVSNANGTVRAKLERLGLARRFETIVDSQEEGIEKPDPRIFRVALRRLQVRPDETAYVGDLFHVDVEGARAAGLRPVLLDPHDLYSQRPCLRIRRLADVAVALTSPNG